jgi:hypothetical protein
MKKYVMPSPNYWTIILWHLKMLKERVIKLGEDPEMVLTPVAHQLIWQTKC